MSQNPFGGGTTGAFRRIEQTLSESDLSPESKAKVVEEVQGMRDELLAFHRDKVFYRIVVSILGFTILFVVGGITFLIANEKQGFDALTAIGSAAVGGLVGLLAPSPISGK